MKPEIGQTELEGKEFPRKDEPEKTVEEQKKEENPAESPSEQIVSDKEKIGEIEPEPKEDDDLQSKESEHKPEQDEKERLLKEIEKKDHEIKELTNRFLRALADYDNVKKRTAKEISNAIQSGCEDLIKKILPVIDTFESALIQFSKNNIDKKVLDGFEMLYMQLWDVLQKEGLKPIEAMGKKFNPNLHEALMKCSDPNLEDEIITKELEKGYLFKDKVIRPTKVEINQK